MIAPILALALLAAPPDLVSYPSGAETVQGFLALPPGPGPHPALILVHEWWGLNDFAKQKAKLFASQGYVTLAVDLYRGPPATDPDTAHQLARGLPEDRAKRDLAAAFAYLASRGDVDQAHIGSIGWCMGGGYALEEALQEPRLAASVIYYGRLPTDPAAVARIKAQLLGNYGAEDRGIPPGVRRPGEEGRRAGRFQGLPGSRARVCLEPRPCGLPRGRRQGCRRPHRRFSAPRDGNCPLSNRPLQEVRKP
jgi:carboxymethylenebutenolidase